MKKATDAQIAGWKGEFGDIYHLTSEDGKYCCYMRKPTRHELGLAAKKSQSNPLAFNNVIIQACWLHGDEEMRTNDEHYLGLSQALDEIIGTVQAEVKKL